MFIGFRLNGNIIIICNNHNDFCLGLRRRLIKSLCMQIGEKGTCGVRIGRYLSGF